MKSVLHEQLGGQCHDLTQDGKSWVLVVQGYMRCPSDAFEEAWAIKPDQRPHGTIMGKSVAFPRYTQAYGHEYSFAGQTATSLPHEDMPPILQRYHASLFVGKCAGMRNGTLVNFYDAQDNDYIGPHSDDERHLVKNAPIFSLTLCDSPTHYRRFRLCPKKNQSSTKTITVALKNGDLLVMGGTCQSTHKHEIMKPTKHVNESHGRRINVTDRLFFV